MTKNCGSGPCTACVVGHAHYVIGSQCLFSHRSACGDKVHSTTKPAWKRPTIMHGIAGRSLEDRATAAFPLLKITCG